MSRIAGGRNLRLRRRGARRPGSQPKVVALGGGMGLSASLAALRRITGDLTDRKSVV